MPDESSTIAKLLIPKRVAVVGISDDRAGFRGHDPMAIIIGSPRQLPLQRPCKPPRSTRPLKRRPPRML
jgi:hypothetical protein